MVLPSVPIKHLLSVKNNVLYEAGPAGMSRRPADTKRPVGITPADWRSMTPSMRDAIISEAKRQPDICAAAVHRGGNARGRGSRRRLVEFCCGENSRLSRACFRKSCRATSITAYDDTTSEKGIAQSTGRGPVRGATLRRSSIPCTGGSPWQRLNITLGKQRRQLEHKIICSGQCAPRPS